ncbi:hypothetical protein [Aquimarina sp. RZ0]|uniref:hypothetical protein n=1 Tax=Aquimarina sp. RZ0 TaxID=2607730 RepID=UPI0011F3BCCF|nr:hypothetical protein [Aquimarina sp. RZ0]KAA1243474.1 hypothetical protein F0000_20790 [Aquimarina sp. RZ0]
MKIQTTKNLKDLIVAFISTPQSDDALVNSIVTKEAKEIIETFYNWLRKISRINSRILVDDLEILNDHFATFTLLKPIKTKVGVICRSVQDQDFDIEKIINSVAQYNTEFILYLSRDHRKENELVEVLKKENILPINANWLTSIVIENSQPFFAQLGESNNFEWTPYISEKTKDIISVKTSKGILDESDELSDRSSILKNYKGDILLATSFLPSITLPVSVITRYYRNIGNNEENILKIIAGREKEIENWKRHINNYNRYDMIHIESLNQYFSNPKYFEMELTEDEIREQIFNLSTILRYDNYTLCLTSESIDLSYEIRNPNVLIRTNTRNKSKSAVERISDIKISDPVVCDKFEKEFWDTYKLIPEKNKSNAYILEYIKDSYDYALKVIS